MDVITDSDYWDCECDVNYIHTLFSTKCSLCRALKEDQPESRVEEIAKYSFNLSAQDICCGKIQEYRGNGFSVTLHKEFAVYFVMLRREGKLFDVKKTFSLRKARKKLNKLIRMENEKCSG